MEPNRQSFEEQAKQTGSTSTDTVDATSSPAGETANRAGEAVESEATHLREHLSETGQAGETAEAVARKVKQTSVYLQQQGIGGVVEILELLIRRYPLQTLLLGLGCGYLLSRARPD